MTGGCVGYGHTLRQVYLTCAFTDSILSHKAVLREGLVIHFVELHINRIYIIRYLQQNKTVLSLNKVRVQSITTNFRYFSHDHTAYIITLHYFNLTKPYVKPRNLNKEIPWSNQVNVSYLPTRDSLF